MAAGHHYPESPIRRNIIILMNLGILGVPEIAPTVGDRMLNYHLHRRVLVGLIELK